MTFIATVAFFLILGWLGNKFLPPPIVIAKWWFGIKD